LASPELIDGEIVGERKKGASGDRMVPFLNWRGGEGKERGVLH
jgi:hypothetical protein